MCLLYLKTVSYLIFIEHQLYPQPPCRIIGRVKTKKHATVKNNYKFLKQKYMVQGLKILCI